MSKADIIFKQNLNSILSQKWEADNRAKWKDGSEIKTKRILQVINKYDLSEEFPALTLRPLALKSCIGELLWVFSRQSNNIKDLNSKVWDSWADESGSIGKAYADQIKKPMMGYNNQVDYVLGEIQKNSTSRRIMMNMFNVEDMQHKNLIECAYATHFSVKDGKLYTTLIQRSGDFLTANNWNLCQYAILTHMVARHCGLEVGVLTHFIQDLHIYNHHEENAMIVLNRESYNSPNLWINPNKKDFYSFEVEDFRLDNYKKHEQLKIEIAI